VDSLLAAVSTVLWGHLDVKYDRLVARLRQVLLDNLHSNSNQDSQLARRWRLHNDVVAAGVDLDSHTAPVNDVVALVVVFIITSATSSASFFLQTTLLDSKHHND